MDYQVSRSLHAPRTTGIDTQIEPDRVSYKFSDAPPITNAEDMGNRLLRWADQHSNPGKQEWKSVSPPKGVNIQELPPFIIMTIVSSVEKKGAGVNINSFLPDVGPGLVWIAPIRTKPLRTYDEVHTPFSPEGTHTPYIIRRMLGSEAEAAKFRRFMDKMGNASGLFERIDIKFFNAEKTGPFEVDAFIDGEALSLGWLGYGASQSLPILVELMFRPKGTWFAIQQPEVHLHPRAQASLGDAFFEMALLDRKTFLVETHSDFTIDRFRINYRAKRSAKERVSLPKGQILFFERRNKQNTVSAIPIEDKGDLLAKQPDSYRRFFIKEEMRLIGIK